MDTYQKIVKQVIWIVALCSTPLSLYANTYTIEPTGRNSLSEDATIVFRNIMSHPEVVWTDITKIDTNELLETDTLCFCFDNNRLEMVATYYDNGFNYHYARYESPNTKAQALVTVFEDYVHIDLRTPSDMYWIISISEKEAAIVKYEPIILEESEYEAVASINTTSDSVNFIRDTIILRTTPVIRVLFLYTPAAMAMMGGNSQVAAMIAEANRYISEGNESFANSNINAQLQLAYVGPTIYDESLHSWNDALVHFYTPNDGYMDEVHALRAKYQADICVLMVDKQVGLCGQATTILANEDSAFCIIWPNYLSCGSRYSAIHELGHLIGCRHNLSKDPTNMPYQYGHGYMYCDEVYDYPTSWCTIMTYENSCERNARRILNWSNPSIYNNGCPTGTSTYENNARVWNERAGTVAAFEVMSNNISYTSTNNNIDAIYEHIEAYTQISTSGGYAIQSGQTVEMKAGTGIRLAANTHIKSGSHFRASIGTPTVTSPSNQSEEEADNADTPEPQYLPARITEETITSPALVQPNPAKDWITIQTEQAIKSISIFDYSGRCVLQTESADISIGHLPPGMYIVRVYTADGQTLQSKFVHK